MSGTRGRLAPDAVRGMLKARDPFELIRWLAYSQPDPRKALAELVQNSLDAGASTVKITRCQEGGSSCLKIFDDGQGVIPEMERRDALQYVATHIGHSRKRHLSPQERLSLMTQGQYGIGLLGFWSLGERLEMRSTVAGDRPHRLTLYRDRPGYVIEPLREHLPLGDRWTEVVVFDLDEAALGATAGKRAADYLAAELRGQLLGRPVEVSVEDRITRGGAGKVIPVTPAPLLGKPIAGVDGVDVPGFGKATIDVGLWDGSLDEAPGIAVYCGGTRVADRFHELKALALDRLPWTDPRLTGTVEYPHFTVPPGSREGILPDDAALAFSRALKTVETRVFEALHEHEEAVADRAERSMLSDLRGAFEEIARKNPGLALLPVARAEGTASETPPRAAEFRKLSPRQHGLLPPGPMVEIVLTPDPVALARGAAITISASARDALGHEVEDRVDIRWATAGAFATVVPAEDDPLAATLTAGGAPGRGLLRATARGAGREVEAVVQYEIVSNAVARDPRCGIPDPAWVEDAASDWRSRVIAGRFEVNTAHPDCRAADTTSAKLRYLSLLLAKEIALHNAAFGASCEEVLDVAVGIAAAAERAMADRGRKKPR
ncbi:MAG TPA: ATP-binding protein [Candidatus Polarisedimenticolaceae bacterium]|nr:ATP-binding protein [Candidatus Polarisedimenticolaceae bacterium]